MHFVIIFKGNYTPSQTHTYVHIYYVYMCVYVCVYKHTHTPRDRGRAGRISGDKRE